MKLLLDQGVPWGAAPLLCDVGIDAVHVDNIGYAATEDVSILQKARDEQQVVVTLDADFHALLALLGAASPSVIRLRIQGLKAEATAALLLEVLDQCSEEITAGAAVTVRERSIRIRRLPLVRLADSSSS